MTVDRFGNPHAPGLPYARGSILASTQDDLRKLQHARTIIERIVRDRGQDAVFNFTGLERSFPLEPGDLAFTDDEIAPALFGERLRVAGLAHLGGVAGTHDVALFNRLTAATVATHLALVNPGDVVVGVSPSYSHPTVVRAAAHAGARFVDTRGAAELAAALAMLLLQDHGIVTVHFAGLPPGTSSLLFKFMPPETVVRFGGPDAFARAVAASVGKLGSVVADPVRLRDLLLGDDQENA